MTRKIIQLHCASNKQMLRAIIKPTVSILIYVFENIYWSCKIIKVVQIRYIHSELHHKNVPYYKENIALSCPQ